MTVAELIKILATMPQDAPIWMESLQEVHAVSLESDCYGIYVSLENAE